MSSYIQLSEANCRNCLRCVRVCPTKAMTYTNHQPTIVENECILCGKCFLVCPHSAKKVSSDFEKVKTWLKQSEKIVISVAPSFAAIWPNYPALKKALLKMGFYRVEETAVGAKIVTQAYSEIIIDHKMKNIISTCCPAVVALVEKNFPDLIDQLAPVVSPIIAHGKFIKEEDKDLKVVFLSPCIAKQKECQEDRFKEVIDATISMEDLAGWIDEDYSIQEQEPWLPFEGDLARLYPTPGGILKTLSRDLKQYNFVSVEGIERCMQALKSIQEGHLQGYFFEMSSCDESCLGGPLLSHYKHNEWLAQSVIRNSVNYDEKIKIESPPVNLLTKWENRKVVRSHFSEEQIDEVLHRMGKINRQKELDCGACGYESCRDKAIAVLEDKADIRICLPYALEHAESISNLIIEHTPNGIIVINELNEIREINPSAREMLKLEGINPIGLPILSVLPSDEVEKIVKNCKGVMYQRNEYPQYEKILEQAFIEIPEQSYIVIILMDLTEEETKEKVIKQMRHQTVNITQQVIDDQMRVVQEIASLLGETTAKSKVALTRLKKAMEEDD